MTDDNSDTKNQSFGSGEKPVKKPTKRSTWRIVVGIVIFLLLIGSSVLAYMMWPRAEQKKPDEVSAGTASVCTQEHITRASQAISAGDIATLRTLEAQIIKLKSYRDDINCNYILARYYLTINDQGNAQKFIDTVAAQRASGTAYSRYFNPPAEPPKQLQTALDIIVAEENDPGRKKMIEDAAAAARAADEAGGVRD